MPKRRGCCSKSVSMMAAWLLVCVLGASTQHSPSTGAQPVMGLSTSDSASLLLLLLLLSACRNNELPQVRLMVLRSV